jgi:integrase
MVNALVRLPASPAPASADFPESERIREYRSASKADATKLALAKNWRSFESWCNQVRRQALPAQPSTVEAFLVYLADDRPVFDRRGRELNRGLKPASILQALWAINQMHRLASHPEPGAQATVRAAMAGIRRRKAHRPKQQAPFTIDEIAQVQFPATLKGLRDKALLLVGFSGCLRRSEVVALRAEDIEPTRHGLRIYLRQSKTDAMGQGAWIDIVQATHQRAVCPVLTLRAWLAAARIESGPIFRPLTRNATSVPDRGLSAVTVDQIVKWAAGELGMDRQRYGGHSLRAGRATYLARQNKPPTLIAKHGRWQSLDMVLRYFRDETAEGLVGSY